MTDRKFKIAKFKIMHGPCLSASLREETRDTAVYEASIGIWDDENHKEPGDKIDFDYVDEAEFLSLELL